MNEKSLQTHNHKIFTEIIYLSGEIMNIFNALIIISAAVLILIMIKKMKPMKIILISLSGLSSLLACDLILSLYGGNMPINIYTVSFSLIGGIPAVIMLMLLKTFFII